MKPGNNGAVILGTSTMGLGQHTNIHGTYISVGSDRVVVGSSTYDRPLAEPTAGESARSALANLAGPTPVSIASNGAFVIGDKTLSSGIQIVISETQILVGSNVIVIGSSTYNPPDISILSTASKDPIILGHEALSEGALTTISSEVVSVGSSIIVLGRTMYSLPKHTGGRTAASRHQDRVKPWGQSLHLCLNMHPLQCHVTRQLRLLEHIQ